MSIFDNYSFKRVDKSDRKEPFIYLSRFGGEYLYLERLPQTLQGHSKLALYTGSGIKGHVWQHLFDKLGPVEEVNLVKSQGSPYDDKASINRGHKIRQIIHLVQTFQNHARVLELQGFADQQNAIASLISRRLDDTRLDLDQNHLQLTFGLINNDYELEPDKIQHYKQMTSKLFAEGQHANWYDRAAAFMHNVALVAALSFFSLAIAVTVLPEAVPVALGFFASAAATILLIPLADNIQAKSDLKGIEEEITDTTEAFFRPS